MILLKCYSVCDKRNRNPTVYCIVLYQKGDKGNINLLLITLYIHSKKATKDKKTKRLGDDKLMWWGSSDWTLLCIWHWQLEAQLLQDAANTRSIPRFLTKETTIGNGNGIGTQKTWQRLKPAKTNIFIFLEIKIIALYIVFQMLQTNAMHVNLNIRFSLLNALYESMEPSS